MSIQWTVTNPKGTRVRNIPSIWGTAYEVLPVNHSFIGLNALNSTDEVNGQRIQGQWVQLPDGRWCASIYNNVTFMTSKVIATWIPGLYRVNHDSPARTSNPNWGGVGAQTPEVFPMFPTQSDKVGTVSTDVSNYDALFSRLNNANQKALDYLYAGNTALFGSGPRKLESLTMGGNVVYIEEVLDGFGRVRTFSSIPADWTWVNHPEAVQRFVVVYWVVTAKITKWIDPPPGPIFWPLICNQQIWIDMTRVNVYPYLNPLT